MIDPPVDNVTLTHPATVAMPIRRRYSWPDRQYTIVLCRAFDDDWVLMQSWGDRHTNRSGGKSNLVQNSEAGLKQLRAIEQRRLQHGYEIVE